MCFILVQQGSRGVQTSGNEQKFPTNTSFEYSLFSHKAIQRLVCTTPERWQRLRHKSSQEIGASWGQRQRMRGGTKIPTTHKDYGTLWHCPWLTNLNVTLDIPKVQEQHHYREAIEKQGRINCHIQSAFEKHKILIKTILAGNPLCFTSVFG